MHRTPFKHPKRGFTLVEVVVTTFITLLGLLGIHQLLFYMMYANAVSAQTTLATALAQDKIEQLMCTPYDDLSGGTDGSPPFARTWTVNDRDDGCKDIVVSIAWLDLRDKSHVIDVRSISTDNRLKADIRMFQQTPVGSN